MGNVETIEAIYEAFGRGDVPDLEIHLYAFGSDGKVTAFRHVFDTAKHAEAQRI